MYLERRSKPSSGAPIGTKRRTASMAAAVVNGAAGSPKAASARALTFLVNSVRLCSI
ncbi:unnamed protein product [Chondrus crispus]|uniref:Uncharacterized protein n=1 Tax=Chondrus crispus TaxID=2769 RepID=R7Q1U6_CHOCR|nr:unnamed protein product [Chondrus crispus]CDF32552.1 unnamed protein product [Chondrus crispus]|eukprot:XP_005712217.1 unnamed protein product [Chondrus crispus]